MKRTAQRRKKKSAQEMTRVVHVVDEMEVMRGLNIFAVTQQLLFHSLQEYFNGK